MELVACPWRHQQFEQSESFPSHDKTKTKGRTLNTSIICYVLRGTLSPSALQIWVKLDRVLWKDTNIHSSRQNTLSQNSRFSTVSAGSLRMCFIHSPLLHTKQIENRLEVRFKETSGTSLFSSMTIKLNHSWNLPLECHGCQSINVWLTLVSLSPEPASQLCSPLGKCPGMKAPCNFITVNRKEAEVKIKW